MKNQETRPDRRGSTMRATILLIVLAMVSTTTQAARAQAPPEVDVQHFHPHANQTGWYATESAETLQLWQPAFGVWFNYANNPFLHRRDGEVEDRIVVDLATLDLQAGIGFGLADIAVDVPIHLRVAGEGLESWGGDFGGAAMGDLRIHPKIRFVDPVKRGFGLGLALPVTLPTGDQQQYVGLRTVAFDPTLLITGYFGKVRLGGNIGYRLTESVAVDDLNVGRGFIFRAAVGVSPIDQLELRGEVFGDVQGRARNNPAEWLIGAAIEIPLAKIFQQVAQVVFLPMILGYATQRLIVRKFGETGYRRDFKPKFPLISTLGLMGIVFSAMALHLYYDSIRRVKV